MEVKTTIAIIKWIGYIGLLGAFLLFALISSEIGVGMAIAYAVTTMIGCVFMFAIANGLELLDRIASGDKKEITENIIEKVAE